MKLFFVCDLTSLLFSNFALAQETPTETPQQPEFNVASTEIDPAVQEALAKPEPTQNDNPPDTYYQIDPVPHHVYEKLNLPPIPMDDFKSHPHFKFLGTQLDVGLPDGAALGMVVRPNLNWMRLNLSGTYNYLAPGIRAGFTLDPINFGIAPTLTAEVGHYFYGTIPNKQTQLSYDYVNLHGGLDFGGRDSCRFFIHGGLSYIKFHTKNFSSLFDAMDGVSFGDPTLSVRLAPTLKLGLVILF